MTSFRPLTISILFHLGLLALLYGLADPMIYQPPVPVEIVYQNRTTPTQKGHFFEDYAPQEESLKDLKNAANRLSAVTRRVQKEIQARQQGRTSNQIPAPRAISNPQPLKELARQELKKTDSTKKIIDNADTDGTIPSITKPMPGSVARNAQTGVSTISNYIPEVRAGGFTALNSDQFIHYTFYARINEQINNRWVSQIRGFVNLTPQNEINRLSSRPQSTRVEIFLTPDGHFVKALVHQRSQSYTLDESAIAAFRLASPLPNPPEEMVEADGFIHLHVLFTIYFSPRYLAGSSR